jgi:hypothetical protein
LEGFFEGLCGLGESAFGSKEYAEVIMHFDIIRASFQDDAAVFDCLVGFACGGKSQGKPAVGNDVVGVEEQGLLIIIDCRSRVSFLSQRLAKHGQNFDGICFRCEHFFETVCGLVINACQREVGIGAEVNFILFDCVIEFTL